MMNVFRLVRVGWRRYWDTFSQSWPEIIGFMAAACITSIAIGVVYELIRR